jgi:hypothetical protein
MYLMRHTIAGITFLTESDIEIKSLQNDWFSRFIKGDAEADVYHQIYKVDETDLTLPALNDKERKQLMLFNTPKKLGPGDFILHPLVRNIKDDDNLIGFQSTQDPFGIPLLQSPRVRERLDACLDHLYKVRLILHTHSVVIFDYRLHRFDLFYRADQKWVFENIPLENGIRRMFSSFLPSFSAVMLHSSGVIRKNRAALFFAPDEGGKSTVVKNMADGMLLCDDRNIIRKEGNTFTAYSTPWGQINNGSQQASLGGLFLIEKGQEFELSLVKPQDILLFLWNEHMQFWNLLPKYLRVNAFQLLADICYNTPCYRMRFPKHYVDWNAIDEAMAD